ncbi:MAG TPA: tRNA uridine-5-carboxymethylaminomethyl(34) synthesis GTPase MnmE [Candidatus Babeliales bacterium]|nr:tRNA uridine-5-carboxymethylaminomethyl(34) synthesis GTPase MnmE [Candidatus Babeliales bacterium]
MSCHSDNRTIVAQSSPSGQGAIALIRISGQEAFEICSKFSNLKSSKKLLEIPSHTICYGTVVDGQSQAIDNVLFLVMRGPSTFTGQDTIEITCHNNNFIIEAIISRAIELGARLAQPGEFSKRAVLAGKIDIVQAEAIKDLLGAQTQQGVKAALAQVEGSLSRLVQSIEEDLFKLLAFINACFEFLDEDVNFDQDISSMVDAIIKRVVDLKSSHNQQRYLLDGVRIAILGPVNVGKSSLFNALLDQNRAIVTAIEGTTRDVIESHIFLNSVQCTLVDTAGIRVTDDIVEQEGIIRSYQEATKADIILLVLDGSRVLGQYEQTLLDDFIKQYGKKIVSVITKSDLAQIDSSILLQNLKTISISTKTQQNIDQLKLALSGKVEEIMGKFDAPFIINKRQFAIITALHADLLVIQSMITEKPISYELVAHYAQKAIEDFCQLTGRTIHEKMLDTIFGEFCIGK